MPPFNCSEEPMQLFISLDDGKTYEPFTGLKDVEIESDDPLGPNPNWVFSPRDVGFSATLTLTNESAKTVKKWGKAIRKYVNRLNRRNRRCKRAKERVRKIAWRAFKGKPPKEAIRYINKVIDDYYSHNWCPPRGVHNVPAVQEKDKESHTGSGRVSKTT